MSVIENARLNPHNSSYQEFPPPKDQVVKIGQIQDLTGLSWTITTLITPQRIFPPNDQNIALDAWKIIKSYSKLDFDLIGQSPKHSEVTRFFLNHWPQIFSHLFSGPYAYGSILEPEPQQALPFEICPEVFLPLPYFGSESGRALDCVGIEPGGNIFIFEIGKGHKTSQLRKQVFLAKTLFPNAGITGAVVKYKELETLSRRLFVRFD